MKGIRSSYIALILAIAVVLSSFPFFVISASAGGGVWNGTASSEYALIKRHCLGTFVIK